MIQSKSMIPLFMRLKQIDEKYKLKKYHEETPSSTSSESFFEISANNVKNSSISGSGDAIENVKHNKIHIKMPDTQMESNLRMKYPNRNPEPSTVVVTIFDKSSRDSQRSDTYSTSKITIDTRSVNEEMGPAGEGNIIANVDVSLHKLQSDKSASLSSISEAIDPEIQTLKESDTDIKHCNGDAISFKITVENKSSSKSVLETDLPVSGDDYRYSDDTFEDVSRSTYSKYYLKYANKSQLEQEKTIAVEGYTTGSIKKCRRNSKMEQSIDSVSSLSEIEEKENRRVIKYLVRNNDFQNKINHGSELMELYINKSSSKGDSEDTENLFSTESSKRSLKKLSKASKEIRKESRQERTSEDSIFQDSPHKGDYSKMHRFHEKSDRKLISKARHSKKLSNHVDSTPLREKQDNDFRNNFKNKTEGEKWSKQGSRTIKFRKISNKIPQQLQVQTDHINASCRCSFILKEEKQRFYQSNQQTSKPILFKPLNFPNIAGFVKTDMIAGTEIKNQNIVLHQRLLEVQSWLKDQFNLYRDYCKVVSAINREYVPSSLIDVKKMAPI